jgi:hypothetical protein
MTFTWSLQGWPDPRKGDNPRVVIIAPEDTDDAAYRCMVFCNVIVKATSNAG